MIARLRKTVVKYLESDKLFPTVIAIATGLYPMLYRFSKNFSIVNSLEHLGYFILCFLILPVVVFNGVNWLLKKIKKENHSLFIMAVLNVFTFLYFIKIITYSSAQRKKTVLIIVVALLFAFYLKKHLKKLVLLQYLLTVVSFVNLMFVIYSNISISNDWQKQPDNIVDVEFKKKPNVYYIQPDGYLNFSEVSKGLYQQDNSVFKSYLDKEGFTSYPNFRSNYSSTLSSNSSFFMMKHHYYNNRISNFELYNARDMIVTKNPVLDVFNNNGYKTHYISETDYLLFNRPKMGYDYCNINYGNIPFIRPGISDPLNVSNVLKRTISETIDQPKFFFIQFLSPWHIKSKTTNSSNDIDIERKIWVENLAKANAKLTETINLIKQNDPNALIIIMADHGGYVGYEYSDQSDTMTQDRDLIYSIFSSQLSIHWPHNEIPNFDDKFKTPVNVFRLVFTHLSEDEKFLSQLQPDESYKVLREGVDVGIYQYINEVGEITLKEHK